MDLPLARADELTIEELGDELLVYDLRTDRAHSLSPVAARVWRACDGRTRAGALAGELGVGPDEVTRALDELAVCDLLAPGAGTGISRRELTVRVVKSAAVAASAPLIISIVAPTPAAALTPGCEAVAGCLDDCGNVLHGCQGTACTCCQLSKLTCDKDGVKREPNVKFCAPGDAANCPPVDNLTECITACTGTAQRGGSDGGRTAESVDPSSSSASGSSPGTSTGKTSGSPLEAEPVPQPAPTTPAPETPTTPEPTVIESP